MEDEQYAELDEIVFRIAELWEEICDAKGELMELDWERLEIEYKLFQKGLL